jgi:hypothetical protein
MKKNDILRITLPTSLGDAEATKPAFVDEPWEINYPWASYRYYGTRSEVERVMTMNIARNDEQDEL